MHILGIDIGGSGIKGAPVDSESGEMLAARLRIATPQPSKPSAVAKVLADIVTHFRWQGPVGCGFPAVVQHGVTLSAANVHQKWMGLDAQALFQRKIKLPVIVINDADAAGLAEMRFGAGRNSNGVVIVITIGTGLGTALFIDGTLVPNTELGHLEIRGLDAEARASDAARKRERLPWRRWAVNFDEYLLTLERLFSPDLFILGGGAAKKSERFFPYLTAKTRRVPARLGNEAGIIGAALAALQLDEA